MTDYRRTEEELWEEEVAAEDDRPTRVLPVLAPEVQAAVAESADPATKPPESEQRVADDGSKVEATVESVARFITEPVRPQPTGARQVDSPSWSLSALSMIENDVAVAERPAERVQPPAIPLDALPAQIEPLPSMMLGPAMSTRSEVTERVTTIPKTHPLANSIAPGGSLVTVPPTPTRGAHRWQFALGGLALIVLGGGAAAFLQSRGEHHAASGVPRWLDQESAERAADERDRKVLVEPMAETMVIIEESPEPVLLDAPPDLAKASLAGESDEGNDTDLAPMLHQAEPDGEPRVASAAPARVRPAVRPKPADGEADNRAAALQITVGSVQLRTREDNAEEAQGDEGGGRPQRAQVIDAMNEIAAQLRACVGEEHGIADVTLTVRGSGLVSHALVEGPFAGSAQGSCIARSLREARLPPFADPLLRIAYPLQL